MRHCFVGFGFGPIQSALFAKLAAESGRFGEIVVGDVDGALVSALQGYDGGYAVNVAYADRIAVEIVHGMRLLNLTKADELAQFREVIGRATEIVTSLPSVAFYTRALESVGRRHPCLAVASLIREGLAHGDAPCMVYTAENNNHAAEILEEAVVDGSPGRLRPTQFLNTVIGKMSQVIDTGLLSGSRLGCFADTLAMTAPRNDELEPIVPDYPRAFLVESFNKILVSKITLPNFTPGITVFEEKEDLLPFEEAKLFGHNAIHAVMGFLCKDAGLTTLAELRAHPSLLEIARTAFVDEVGVALVRKYGSLGDALFTSQGMTAYAEDLLGRMTNPYLADAADRSVRDPLRKLGADDRLFGAMRLCLAQGVEPRAFAVAVRAALRYVETLPEGASIKTATAMDAKLAALWGDTCPVAERKKIAQVF